VEAGSAGEVAMEQAFLKFDIKSNMYISAGLFTPRIGIINENHLPTTYNGTERPIVEQMVLPSTWREIGVALYGSSYRVPGLNYSLGIVNGLNAAGFSMDAGIREGRYEGQLASARNKAITGSLLYYYGPLRLQTSAYIGGSVGVADSTANKLGLSTGFFGTPVFVNEANIQFRRKGLVLKALGAVVNIPDADKINAAYANNTPKMMTGEYFEAGYDVLHPFSKKQQLFVFARYEHIDMNAQLPENGIENKAFTQNHVIAGVSFLPTGNIVIKADFHLINTGNFNQNLIINPDPSAPGYQPTKQLVQLGIGYSF
jgi:opacity protein-like surface antigen